jgi:hypothetical protein
VGPRLPVDGRVLSGVLLAAAFGLRVPGLFHDFWLDEAWSALLVREFVSSSLDVLRIHLDNNHPLNSWFLYVLGNQPQWYVYRLPSLVLGTATVALAGTIMSRRGRPHALVAMTLVGSSYPLIVYSSEARGYAAMVCCVLLAIDAYERFLRGRTPAALIMFWVATVFGMLSHATFMQAYGAILLWSIYEEHRREVRWQDALTTIVRIHAMPLLFFASFYAGFLRHLVVAGAEPAGAISVVGETLAVTLGIAPNGVGPWIAAGVIGWLFVAGLAAMRNKDRGLFVLMLSGSLLLPAFAVLVERRDALIEPRLFPRYFLVSITLFLLLSAWFVGEQYQRGTRRRRMTVSLFLGLCVIGHLWHTARFIQGGRGQYREAVHYMAAATIEPEIRVSSNSDFRTSTLLAFYRSELPPGKALIFFPAASRRLHDANWRIIEELEPNRETPAELVDQEGGRFRIVKRWPFYGLSGCQWTLYRRIDSRAVPPLAQHQ